MPVQMFPSSRIATSTTTLQTIKPPSRTFLYQVANQVPKTNTNSQVRVPSLYPSSTGLSCLLLHVRSRDPIFNLVRHQDLVTPGSLATVSQPVETSIPIDDIPGHMTPVPSGKGSACMWRLRGSRVPASDAVRMFFSKVSILILMGAR
jgi:hypothetical protein